MSLLSGSIPRVTEIRRFYDEPLGFLARARSSLGDLFVIRDAGPIFSRTPECVGVLAVFGPAHHRVVLSEIDLFGMPRSAAEHLSLPQNLVNLNRGLHSMRGEQHAKHQSLLMRVLGENSIVAQHEAVIADVNSFVRGWQPGQSIALLDEMRRLALQVSTRLLFGDQDVKSAELALLLQAYFQFRREATSPFNPASETALESLITLGDALDSALRRQIRSTRRKNRASWDGLLTKLAHQELKNGERVSENELVAHLNVLFMSSTEPIAVALTWICLILSQLPELRRALRSEIGQISLAAAAPPARRLARLTLMESVINESLRLFPPNALMARVTTKPADLNGVALPERCEIVLCPFIAHRDARRFPNPNQFLPSRWSKLKPSPFEYFPFGAGGHSCVGRHLATYLIKAALSIVLLRYDLILAADQEIDWRIHIQFMPSSNPMMLICEPEASNLRAGKLFGPIRDLIDFPG